MFSKWWCPNHCENSNKRGNLTTNQGESRKDPWNLGNFPQAGGVHMWGTTWVIKFSGYSTDHLMNIINFTCVSIAIHSWKNQPEMQVNPSSRPKGASAHLPPLGAPDRDGLELHWSAWNPCGLFQRNNAPTRIRDMEHKVSMGSIPFVWCFRCWMQATWRILDDISMPLLYRLFVLQVPLRFWRCETGKLFMMVSCTFMIRLQSPVSGALQNRHGCCIYMYINLCTPAHALLVSTTQIVSWRSSCHVPRDAAVGRKLPCYPTKPMTHRW